MIVRSPVAGDRPLVHEVLTRCGLSGWVQALTLFLGVDEDDAPAFELLDLA